MNNIKLKNYEILLQYAKKIDYYRALAIDLGTGSNWSKREALLQLLAWDVVREYYEEYGL